MVNRWSLEGVNLVREEVLHQEVGSIGEGRGAEQVSCQACQQAVNEQWDHHIFAQCVHQTRFGDDEQVQLVQ